jgi:hypothetical protein
MGRCAGTDRVRPSTRMNTQWLLFWCRQSMPFWRATVCRSLICQSSWARRMAARTLVAVFMRHDTTGEIAARRELPSLVQILATSRRTTGLKVDRSVTWKIASGCNGSMAAGRLHGLASREQSHGRCCLRDEPRLSAAGIVLPAEQFRRPAHGGAAVASGQQFHRWRQRETLRLLRQSFVECRKSGST